MNSLRNLIGKAPMNPLLFYSGKFAGYFVWLVLLLEIIDVKLVYRNSNPFAENIALSLLILGLLLVVISLLNLGQSTRFGLPINDTNLKSGGLYKFSRNPMYMGFYLITIASCLYTLNGWIILLGIYSIIVYHLIILGEEKFLKSRFGNSYMDYMNRVGRYF